MRYADITPDGLLIRNTKFRKSRLVVLHDSARAVLEQYLSQRRAFAPLDDHVFVSLRGTPLIRECVNSISASWSSASACRKVPVCHASPPIHCGTPLR